MKPIKYRGYGIRKWVHFPSGRKMLVAIPLKAKCFFAFIDGTEGGALKDLKIYLDLANKE